MTPAFDITFDEATHTYTVCGKPAVSVTTALSVIEDWSKIHADVLKRAGDFGTAVHTMTELYDQDDLDEDTLDPALAPYLAGYQAFLAAKKPAWELIEGRVGDPALRAAGTLDRMGLIGQTRWLIDIKSTAGVPVTVGPQTAAYNEFATKTYGLRAKKRACLILKPGGFSFVPLNDPSDYSMFVSCLNCWRFIEKHHGTNKESTNDAA